MTDVRVLGLILAGGRATRMAGVQAGTSDHQARTAPANAQASVRATAPANTCVNAGHGDKGAILLAGEPLAAHVARRLAPSVDGLLISANRNERLYARYGAVVADDPLLGAWQGPLVGILAGLQAAGEGWVATAPCDTPFLPWDMVPRLLRAARQAGARLAVVRTQGRRQPLCMVARADLACGLRAALLAGVRKVADWQTSLGAIEVDFDPAGQAFANINTPADLARAERYLDSGLSTSTST